MLRRMRKGGGKKITEAQDRGETLVGLIVPRIWLS